MMRVTMAEISAVKPEYCPSGIRRWFYQCGFTHEEFRNFMKNGIDADEFVRRTDWRGADVVERMKQRG